MSTLCIFYSELTDPLSFSALWKALLNIFCLLQPTRSGGWRKKKLAKVIVNSLGKSSLKNIIISFTGSLRRNTSLRKEISKRGNGWFWAKLSLISTIFLFEYKKTNPSKIRKDLSPQQKFQLFPSFLTRETYKANAAMGTSCFIHSKKFPATSQSDVWPWSQ